MKLYELDRAELDLLGKIEALYEPAEDGEFPVDDPGGEAQKVVDRYLEQLAAVQEQIGPKIEGYVHVIRSRRYSAALLDAEANLVKAELKRLQDKAKRLEADADFFEGRLKAFMEKRQLKELEAGKYTLKIANRNGKLALRLDPAIRPDVVGDAYRKEVPAYWEFDKTAIEADLKAGKTLFVEITDPVTEQPVTVEWAKYDPRPTVLKIS